MFRAIRAVLGVEDTTLRSDGIPRRKFEWGALLISLVGAMFFLLGAGRCVIRQSFSFTVAIYCCLALIPAGLLLLIITYVVQHARLISVLPLLISGLLILRYPVFDVALGLALMGTVGIPAWSDWKSKKTAMKSATLTEGRSDPDRL